MALREFYHVKWWLFRLIYTKSWDFDGVEIVQKDLDQCIQVINLERFEEMAGLKIPSNFGLLNVFDVTNQNWSSGFFWFQRAFEFALASLFSSN